MKRIDSIRLFILLLIPVLIFFPLLDRTYFYTDEILQLWLYKKGTDFAMFVSQGRFLNDWLFRSLYSHIYSVDQLRYLRLFSLAGWLVSLPVWYWVFRRVCRKEDLPESLPFFATLFLELSLSFGISVQWAACMELFIANTCGLLSGFLVYRYGRRGWAPALLLGLVSLLFYQNGFGCYLLPFFLQVIGRQKADRKLVQPLLFYFSIYVVYYILVRAMLHGNMTDRAALLDDPLAKIYYWFSKVLPAAFYFNVVIYEKSILGRLLFGIIVAGMLWLNYRYFIRCREGAAGGWPGYLFYVFLLFGGWVLVYLPSMVIHENFASNRTLLGLDIAVFLWVALTSIRAIENERVRSTVIGLIGILLVLVGGYNFRKIFLPPAEHEYTVLKTFIDKNYTSSIQSVDFIRTQEDEVRGHYGVQSSWDEYGMSSSYFGWVPDAATRQLVFEKIGDRKAAEKLSIKVWSDRKTWEASGQPASSGHLVIDVPALLRQ